MKVVWSKFGAVGRVVDGASAKPVQHSNGLRGCIRSRVVMKEDDALGVESCPFPSDYFAQSCQNLVV